MQDREISGEAYAYGRTRSSGVFALAGIASLAATMLTGGTWAALGAAVESDAIADPPDLRGFAQAIEGSGAAVVAMVSPAESRAQEGPAARGSR